MSELVILGNSLAAIAAIESFRKVDDTTNIIIVSKEPWDAYSRPMIAEFLTGEKSYNEIRYQPESFYETINATKINSEVVQLNDQINTVFLSNGKEIQYEQLLIATGSIPVRAKIPGNHREGVFCFWTLDDAQKIAKKVISSETAVVVGAGLIGQSAAYALSQLGLQVVVIEMLDQILPQNLDQPAAKIVQRYMENTGIQVLTGRRLQEINGPGADGSVTNITLDDGRQISCEIVTMCTGVRPSIDFLQDSKIQTKSGVIVNKYFESSIPNIYAAGDVAEPYDPVYRSNRMVANLPNAREQGRIAGMNLAGAEEEYRGGIGMTSMRYFGIPWVSVGAISCPRHSCQDIIQLYSKDDGLYEKLIIEDNRILGAIFIGEISQSGIITDLIRNRTKLDASIQNFTNRGQFLEYIRNKIINSEMEGPLGYISWKKRIGMEKKYKKTIDEDRWRMKERSKTPEN